MPNLLLNVTLITLMQISSDGVMSMPNTPRLRDPEHPVAVVASVR